MEQSRMGQDIQPAVRLFDTKERTRLGAATSGFKSRSIPYRQHAMLAKVDAQFAFIGEDEDRRQPAWRSKGGGHTSIR